MQIVLDKLIWHTKAMKNTSVSTFRFGKYSWRSYCGKYPFCPKADNNTVLNMWKTSRLFYWTPNSHFFSCCFPPLYFLSVILSFSDIFVNKSMWQRETFERTRENNCCIFAVPNRIELLEFTIASSLPKLVTFTFELF